MFVIRATILSQIICQIIKILYLENKHKYLDEHLMIIKIKIKIKFMNTLSALTCMLAKLPTGPH